MSAKRNIWMNEDDAHFYISRTAEDMNEASLRALVDYYVDETMVEGVLFCIGMQKALFDSKVWEPLYGGYDPEGGPDQPFFNGMSEETGTIHAGDHGRNWVHNLWTLHRKNNLDQFTIWLDQCRKRNVQGWLTLRMNDCHGLEEYLRQQAGTGDYQGWALICPSTFWKEHPEHMRAPYRYERSWEGAYNYAHEEIQQRYLDLLGEAFERYDLDGMELDWLRWGMNFVPGHEREGRQILTGFMRKVKGFADKAAKRLGHPVQLGVRIPAEPQSALDLGYDVPRWADEGLIDQVVITAFGGTANFNPPIEIWRRLLGKNIRILAHVEKGVAPYPGFGFAVNDDGFFTGSADASLARGADGLYLFNICYHETGEADRALLKEQLTMLGDQEKLSKSKRRYARTRPQVYAAGESTRAALPVPLIQSIEGTDFGRMEKNITVRIHTGELPTSGEARIHLGFCPQTPTLDWTNIPLRVNGTICEPTVTPADYAEQFKRLPRPETGTLGSFASFKVSLAVLKEQTNVIEFEPPAVTGELRWAELEVACPQ